MEPQEQKATLRTWIPAAAAVLFLAVVSWAWIAGSRNLPETVFVAPRVSTIEPHGFSIAALLAQPDRYRGQLLTGQGVVAGTAGVHAFWLAQGRDRILVLTDEPPEDITRGEPVQVTGEVKDGREYTDESAHLGLPIHVRQLPISVYLHAPMGPSSLRLAD